MTVLKTIFTDKKKEQKFIKYLVYGLFRNIGV